MSKERVSVLLARLDEIREDLQISDTHSSIMLTVKEYAAKHDVKPRMVQKWAQEGRIKAQRFGDVWAIEDSPRPTDKRFVENPIRNRRK